MGKWEWYPDSYADKNWLDNVSFDKGTDLYGRIMALTGALTSEKEIEKGKKKNGTPDMEKTKEYARRNYRELLLDSEYNTFLEERLKSFPHLLSPPPLPEETLSHLPFCSFFLSFEFTLKKPYISRDDEPYYIIDNPVRKDKVFKIPMVSPSQWKGTLHAAMARDISSKASDADFINRRIQSIKLFGYENTTISDFLNKERPETKNEFERQLKWKVNIDANGNFLNAGRLRFSPSYFNKISIEIINPHDRVKKAGTNPIYLECVPKNSHALFQLLYVPFDLIGEPRDLIITPVLRDLGAVAKMIQDVFIIYGFGAKITSGFGVAKNELTNGSASIKGYHQNGHKNIPIKFSSFSEMKNRFDEFIETDGRDLYE